MIFPEKKGVTADRGQQSRTVEFFSWIWVEDPRKTAQWNFCRNNWLQIRVRQIESHDYNFLLHEKGVKLDYFSSLIFCSVSQLVLTDMFNRQRHSSSKCYICEFWPCSLHNQYLWQEISGFVCFEQTHQTSVSALLVMDKIILILQASSLTFIVYF